MSKGGQRWVTEYDVAMAYGGAEEGGWWYEIRQKVQSTKFSTRGAAERFANRHNSEFDWERRHGHDHKHFVVESRKELGCEDNTNKPRPYYE